MGLNEEDTVEEEQEMKRKNNCAWCTPMGICFFIGMTILLGMGAMFAYFLLKDHV